MNKLKAILATFATLLIVACSGSGGAVPPEGTGELGFAISLTGGATLTDLTYSIGIGGSSTYTGDVPIGSANAVGFQVGSIADGAGYIVKLTGTDSKGFPCSGSSGSLTVNTGAVTSCTITVTCGSDAGECPGPC